MKKTTTLVLLVLVLASTILPAGAMIDGVIDEGNLYPNVGAIMMVWPQFDDIIGRLCSGTLIHPRALLTAAHCYTFVVNQGIDEAQMWVTFHHDPLAGDADYLNVEALIPHPDFEWGKDSHDIALVILEEPVEGVGLQPWPTDIGYMDDLVDSLKGQDKRDLELTVVGYGISDVDLEVPAVQLDATRRFGSVTFDQLLETEIRSGSRDAGDVNLCFGDSGGPLFHENVLVGVLSSIGRQCENAMTHYRVDTADALAFINSTLADYVPAE